MISRPSKVYPIGFDTENLTPLVHSKLRFSHFFSSNGLSELGLGAISDSLERKSHLLVLGTSFAHPLFSLSTNR